MWQDVINWKYHIQNVEVVSLVLLWERLQSSDKRVASLRESEERQKIKRDAGAPVGGGGNIEIIVNLA